LPRTKPALAVTEVGLEFGFPNYQHYAVCVKKCPKEGDSVEYLVNNKYGVGNRELAGAWEYNTDTYLGFCFPHADKITDTVAKVFEEMNKELGTYAKYVNDIVNGWPIILIVGLLSLAITVGYMYILKWITKIVMFTSLFLILVLGVLVTLWNFRQMSLYPEGSEDAKYSQAFGIISAVLTGLYVCFLCCQWRNIMIGSEILGCAGDFVATTP
jgi:amino acid transporter